ncbi:hypothetical protein O181_038799 [Austropuccinia psidii MF-1]|uniref:Uncharacterized protein n=1 Tax=Austropuccinia psidii MF-1 TaxID=1389203 RepID=A0A9Q3D921_9BASI|nr:hypothetical protein [Austropuccinia psidii MF-1]
MHNWFEGILQHHFRYQWGFDCKSETQHNDSDSESDDMEICKAQMQLQKGHVSANNKKRLLLNIHDVVVPKGVTRMPLALGESQSGKLKASEWNALFNVSITLVKLLTKPELRESDFERIEELLQRLDILQVVSNGLFSFIRMEKICAFAAYRRLPAWTLGIQKPTLLVRAIIKLVGLETQGLIDNLFLDDVMQS